MHIFSYTFFTLLAASVVSIGIIKTYRKQNPSKMIISLVFVSLINAFLGARFLYLITSNQSISYQQLVDLNFHGFSLFGGLFAGAITGATFSKINKFKFWQLADISSIWIGIGIAIMRLGCYIQGCCFGIETNLPWGVKPSIFSTAHFNQINDDKTNFLTSLPIHPTQVYELIAALIASAIALYLTKKRVIPGIPTLTWIIAFTSLRWLIWYARAPSLTYTSWPYLYPISYALIIISTLILLIYKIQKSATPGVE